MTKKQQSLLFKIAIVGTIVLVAYFLFRNVENEVKGKVTKRVGKDIAKEAGRDFLKQYGG